MQKIKKTPGPRRLKVNSKRNSACSVPLDSLDWSWWFTDYGFSGEVFYLHFRSDEGIVCVHCRLTERPRLEMKNGELYWLIDAAQPVS